MRVFNNPHFANVTALLALVVALTGTAYAANTVRSGDIVNGQVKGKDLANNSVKGPKVKDGSLTAADLAAGAVPKTSAYATYRDASFVFTAAAGMETALSLTIPTAGTYVILGKLELNQNDDFTTRPTCQVTSGGNTDSGRLGLGPNSLNDDVQTATFVVTTTLAGAGTALLQCDAGTGVEATQRKIVAIKVDSLVNTPAASPRGVGRAEVK